MSPEEAAATQALHEIRALLGFDNDGDETPGAQIAGAGSVQAFAQQVVNDVREYVADLDEAEEENAAEVEGFWGQLTSVRRLVDEAALGHNFIHCKELSEILDGPASTRPRSKADVPHN